MILSIIWWYWIIGVLFTCLTIYRADQMGFVKNLYEEYLEDSDKENLPAFEYKTFEMIGWIIWFIIIPIIWLPFILILLLRK